MKDRELDVLMAEKVMGWKKCRITACCTPGLGPDALETWRGRPPKLGRYEEEPLVPHYSKYIAVAWEVAEKIGLFRNNVHLYEKAVGVQKGSTWTKTGWVWVVEQILEPLDHNVVYATSDTPARALCLAAVKVIDAEVSV